MYTVPLNQPTVASGQNWLLLVSERPWYGFLLINSIVVIPHKTGLHFFPRTFELGLNCVIYQGVHDVSEVFNDIMIGAMTRRVKNVVMQTKILVEQ